MTRVFDPPRRLVFDAWTKPDHLPHWMLGPEAWTMPVCELDLRSGGGWHFVWRRSDGTEMDMRGVYRRDPESDTHARRDARYHHALLVDRHGRFFGPHVSR